MSFTDLQHVDPLGRDGHLGMWHKVAMWVPDLSLNQAVMWLLGITLGGASAPALFGAIAEGAPVVALLTTIVGGLLLIWRAKIEQDTKHTAYVLRQRDRELSTLRYRMRKYGITEEPTDE